MATKPFEEQISAVSDKIIAQRKAESPIKEYENTDELDDYANKVEAGKVGIILPNDGTQLSGENTVNVPKAELSD